MYCRKAFIFFAVFLIVYHCHIEAAGEKKPAGTSARKNTQSTKDLINHYSSDWRDLNHFYNINFSTNYLKRKVRFLKKWKQKLEKAGFYDRSHEEKIDICLLRNEIRYNSEKIEDELRNTKEIMHLVPFTRDIIELETDRKTVQKIDLEKTANRLHSICDSIEKMRNRIKKGGLKKII